MYRVALIAGLMAAKAIAQDSAGAAAPANTPPPAGVPNPIVVDVTSLKTITSCPPGVPDCPIKAINRVIVPSTPCTEDEHKATQAPPPPPPINIKTKYVELPCPESTNKIAPVHPPVETKVIQIPCTMCEDHKDPHWVKPETQVIVAPVNTTMKPEPTHHGWPAHNTMPVVVSAGARAGNAFMALLGAGAIAVAFSMTL